MALWTPAEITSGLWLDAADGSTVTVATGVSGWTDKSGNNRDFSQTTTAWQPEFVAAAQNGLSALRFNGSSHSLASAVAMPQDAVTIFIARKLNNLPSSGAFHCLFCLRASSSARTDLLAMNLPGYRPHQLINDHGATTTGVGIDTALDTSPHVFCWTYNNGTNSSTASYTIHLDGAEQTVLGGGTTGISDVAASTIGKRIAQAIYAAMDLYELVILPGVADAGTIAKTEGYLAHKWGLAANLPAGHPYRATAPTLGGGLSVQAPLEQPWDIVFDALAMALDQPWGITAGLAGPFAQPWGLRLGRDLVEPWGNAPVRVAGMAQPWRDAGELARGLVQPWQDAAPLTAGLAQEWDILGALAAGLVQPWAIAADAALVGSLAQGWDLRDVVPLSTGLTQSWTIGTDPALLRYTLTVTVDGHAVQVDSMTLEADLDQDALHATISLGDLADYQRCRDLAEVVVRVAINGGAAEEYQLVQTSARIDERHGDTRYEVQAESALVLLGEPYAQPVSVEECTGAASVIAATLCAPLTLAWQTVDWTLPSGALVAAGETPLELIKRLAAAVGAVVQARPDGSVRVAPEYPLSLPSWPTATPDLVWIETERSEQVAGQPERRSGYNKYLIGETLTAADSLRLEEETISETVKLVRGYQVPWIGAFALVHTGGSWVQVEDLGIETRQETEVVEIVAGEGRVRYPIQSRDSVRWLHTSLGALTVSEDGTVRADVAGQSLCEVTYTTRCRKWRVRDGRNEQLQLVAEI